MVAAVVVRQATQQVKAVVVLVFLVKGQMVQQMVAGVVAGKMDQYQMEESTAAAVAEEPHPAQPAQAALAS